jgi:hypothetical protein
MSQETHKTECLSGSGPNKMHWPLVHASRHRLAQPEAGYSCGRPLVQSPDTGFQPAPITAASESRPSKRAALQVLPKMVWRLDHA